MDPISIFSGLMMLSMATDLDRTKNYVTDLEGQIVQMELDQADAYEQMMEQKQAYTKLAGAHSAAAARSKTTDEAMAKTIESIIATINDMQEHNEFQDQKIIDLHD